MSELHWISFVIGGVVVPAGLLLVACLYEAASETIKSFRYKRYMAKSCALCWATRGEHALESSLCPMPRQWSKDERFTPREPQP